MEKGNEMEFDPVAMRIEISKNFIQRFGLRQFIALYAHELVHFVDWVIIKRFDAEKWNDDPNSEYWAEKVQDLMLVMIR